MPPVKKGRNSTEGMLRTNSFYESSMEGSDFVNDLSVPKTPMANVGNAKKYVVENIVTKLREQECGEETVAADLITAQVPLDFVQMEMGSVPSSYLVQGVTGEQFATSECDAGDDSAERVTLESARLETGLPSARDATTALYGVVDSVMLDHGYTGLGRSPITANTRVDSVMLDHGYSEVNSLPVLDDTVEDEELELLYSQFDFHLPHLESVNLGEAVEELALDLRFRGFEDTYGDGAPSTAAAVGSLLDADSLRDCIDGPTSEGVIFVSDSDDGGDSGELQHVGGSGNRRRNGTARDRRCLRASDSRDLIVISSDSEDDAPGHVEERVSCRGDGYRSAEVVAERKLTSAGQSRNAVCAICLESLMSGQPVSSIRCGHCFCSGCVREAVRKFGKCPTCCRKANVKDIRPIFL